MKKLKKIIFVLGAIVLFLYITASDAKNVLHDVSDAVTSQGIDLTNLTEYVDEDAIADMLDEEYIPEGIPEDAEGPYKVVYVTDGDTFKVQIDSKEVTVRLIGVDTPESKHPDKAKNTDEGLVATEFTKDMLLNKNVYLAYDQSKTDPYDRLLAYAYLEDGEMVNKILVEEGVAQVMTVPPNTMYQKIFESAYEDARSKNAGFFSTGFFQ